MTQLTAITRRLFCGGLLALPASLGALPARAGIDFNGRIGWRGLETGMAEAARDAKPIFMVIQADWCPACRKYSGLFRDPAVITRLQDFVPVLLEAGKDRATRNYRPDGGYIPRSLVLSPGGQHYAEITGPYKSRYFLPPSDAAYLLNYLDRGLARSRGTQVAAIQPQRRAAPLSEGDGPSFRRPGTASAAQDLGGPKRLRAPQPAAETAPSPDRTEAASEPGLIERLLSIFF